MEQMKMVFGYKGSIATFVTVPITGHLLFLIQVVHLHLVWRSSMCPTIKCRYAHPANLANFTVGFYLAINCENLFLQIPTFVQLQKDIQMLLQVGISAKLITVAKLESRNSESERRRSWAEPKVNAE